LFKIKRPELEDQITYKLLITLTGKLMTDYKAVYFIDLYRPNA